MLDKNYLQEKWVTVSTGSLSSMSCWICPDFWQVTISTSSLIHVEGSHTWQRRTRPQSTPKDFSKAPSCKFVLVPVRIRLWRRKCIFKETKRVKHCVIFQEPPDCKNKVCFSKQILSQAPVPARFCFTKTALVRRWTRLPLWHSFWCRPTISSFPLRQPSQKRKEQNPQRESCTFRNSQKFLFRCHTSILKRQQRCDKRCSLVGMPQSSGVGHFSHGYLFCTLLLRVFLFGLICFLLFADWGHCWSKYARSKNKQSSKNFYPIPVARKSVAHESILSNNHVNNHRRENNGDNISINYCTSIEI